MLPLETNTDVLEPINFCYLSSKDLGEQPASEQLKLMYLLSLQMHINTNNHFWNEYRDPEPIYLEPYDIKTAEGFECIKVQLANAVFLN
jgi:hypothetical protein